MITFLSFNLKYIFLIHFYRSLDYIQLLCKSTIPWIALNEWMALNSLICADVPLRNSLQLRHSYSWRPISLMFRPYACQLSAVVPFRLLVLRSGTAYQMMSPPLCPCQPSSAIWRHTYSAAVTTLSDSAHLLYLLWLYWSSWWRCCLGHSKNFCDDDADGLSQYKENTDGPVASKSPQPVSQTL